MTRDAVQSAAEELRRRCPSGGSAPDPFAIARTLDVPVTVRDIGKLKGFYCMLRGSPVIILSDTLRGVMADIVCAHELGHHILHQSMADKLTFSDYDLYVSEVRLEQEANLFAAFLLIPEERLQEELHHVSEGGLSLDELARRCGTTQQLMAIRLGCSERPVVFPDGAVQWA